MRKLTSDDLARLMHSPRARGRSKYRAIPEVYAGVRYASRAEAYRARELDTLLAAGVISAWFAQVTVRLGVPENVYRPDFLVIPNLERWFLEGGDRDPWFEDVKGKETPKFRRDKILWAAYGPLELRIRTAGEIVEVIPRGRKSKP